LKVWATIDQINSDDLLLVASSWDCASRTGEKNDFTANVVIGRLRSGGFVVLDVLATSARKPHFRRL
jgi:phage terminase large subunit-like protein